MEKVAIVGTAKSWMLTPWDDPTIQILSLNDAYRCAGFKRADGWYDIHPPDHFWTAPLSPAGEQTVVFQHQVPVGHYVRPAGHLDWLATQQMPVWLHPDHATLLPASATWPSARAFPKAEIEAHFGRYFTSTPGWMLAHAILQGAKEVHIYGIHLSTESEYIEQRPNFEFLIGCVLGAGKRTTTVSGGLRRYETQDGIIVLPEASPILHSNFQYAFEVSPRRAADPLQWELHKAEIKRQRALMAVKTARFGFTRLEDTYGSDQVSTRTVTMRTAQQRLYHYEALVADCQEQLRRVALAAHGA